MLICLFQNPIVLLPVLPDRGVSYELPECSLCGSPARRGKEYLFLPRNERRPLTQSTVINRGCEGRFLRLQLESVLLRFDSNEILRVTDDAHTTTLLFVLDMYLSTCS